MNIKEINSKTIIRKQKKIDSWFLSRYGGNLYRGCLHNCVYCDGRSEKYQVEGEFGQDISVKINALELINKELDPKRKRKSIKPAYLLLGGGVGDSYQPTEKKYNLMRGALNLAEKYNYPVHILTKSTLVKRDLEIIKKINEKTRVLLSFSFSSVNKKICDIFEPGVTSPAERISILKQFKENGIACGIFMMPVIPFISDSMEEMEKVIKTARDMNIDYIIFGGMTLKEGRQKKYFYNVLEKNYPELYKKYNEIYYSNKWGEAIGNYYVSINKRFYYLAKKYKIPVRIPPKFYKDILQENDLIIVILEQLDYILKLMGRKSPYSYSAYSISKLDFPVSTIKDRLQTLKGVGEFTEKIILEILKTKSSSSLEKLLYQ